MGPSEPSPRGAKGPRFLRVCHCAKGGCMVDRIRGSFPTLSSAGRYDRGFLVAAGDSAELTNWLTVTPTRLTCGGYQIRGSFPTLSSAGRYDRGFSPVL